MFNIELNARYLTVLTQIYNFLDVWVIYTNYASNVMLIFYILTLGETFFICWITLPADLKIEICKKKNDSETNWR